MNYSRLFNSLPIFYERLDPPVDSSLLKKLPVGNMDTSFTQTDLTLLNESGNAESHLIETGYSYWQHWRRAMVFFLKTTKVAWIFFIHAWVPDVYQTKGRDMLLDLLTEMTR